MKRKGAPKPGDKYFVIGDRNAPEEERASGHHVEKRKRKNSSLQIVFDPAAHKDFVTGFRKRKNQRRQEAQRQLAEKERRDRLERRKELRDARAKAVEEKFGKVDDSVNKERSDGGAAEPEVETFETEEYTTTVTIETIKQGGYSDRSEDETEDEDEDEDDEPTSSRPSSSAPGSSAQQFQDKNLERKKMLSAKASNHKTLKVSGKRQHKPKDKPKKKMGKKSRKRPGQM